MGTPFIHLLSSELEKAKWSLCQLHMRSSYLGYGTGSLNRDFEDISTCISYLLANGKRHVVLMGHSTGSQNGIHYVLNRLNAESSPSLTGVIVCRSIPHCFANSS
jgi:predicted alpha/beta-fold hydrolase